MHRSILIHHPLRVDRADKCPAAFIGPWSGCEQTFFGFMKTDHVWDFGMHEQTDRGEVVNDPLDSSEYFLWLIGWYVCLSSFDQMDAWKDYDKSENGKNRMIMWSTDRTACRTRRRSLLRRRSRRATRWWTRSKKPKWRRRNGPPAIISLDMFQKTKLYQIIKSKIDSQRIIEAYEQSSILQISFHSVHCWRVHISYHLIIML